MKMMMSRKETKSEEKEIFLTTRVMQRKKHKVRRFLAVFLAAVMVCSLFGYNGGMTVQAAETSGTCGADGADLTWTFDGSTLTISGNGAMADFDFSKEPWFSDREKIQTIVIKNGVTTIGSYAFYGCRNLISISIPEGVTTIRECAFQYCSKLPSISIPEEVTTIGAYAFEQCSKLESISIPNGVTTIGCSAFEKCSAVTSISISSSVEKIDSSSFASCSDLKTIEVDSNNKTYNSAGNCNAIIETASKTLILGCKNTTIPKEVTTIGDNAFCDCSGLESISIPESVTTIGDNAFGDCSGLESISIPESVTTIKDGAFGGCSGLKSISIPESVTTIGDYAFSDCDGLKSISIPESVTTIGNYGTLGTFSSNITINNYSDCNISAFDNHDNWLTVNSYKVINYHLNDGDTEVTWSNKELKDYTNSKRGFKVGAGNTTLAEESDIQAPDGKVFAGWYNDQNGSGNKVISIPTSQSTSVDLYAKWNPKTEIGFADGKSVSDLSAVYTGNPIEHSTRKNDLFKWDGDESLTLTYYLENGETLTGTKEDTSSGASSEGGAPVKPGNYVVKATVARTDTYGENEQSYNFTISKIPGEAPTISMQGWTYGGIANTPQYDVPTKCSSNVRSTEYALKDSNEWTTTVPTNAGTYKVRVNFDGTDYYTGATSNAAEFTIGKKAITVQMKDATRRYKESNPNFDFDVSEGALISEDTKKDLTITPVTSATNTSTVGTYDITGTSESANYDVTVKKGTLTITTAENAPNMPSATMTPGYLIKTVGAVTLPSNWEWNTEDATKELVVGKAMNAKACYVGEDKDNYENKEVEVEITRAACTHKGETEIRNAKSATCTEDGYTGDTYCKDCGALVKKGEVIKATGHKWGEWKVTTKATYDAEGVETRVCSVCGKKETRAIAKLTKPAANQMAAKGKTYTVGSMKYKVTAVAGNKTGTVTYTGTTKSKKITSLTIGKTVKIGGKTYKVTAISDKAFKNNKNLKKVAIGANVTSIGKETFAGCKAIKTITIQSKNLKKIGKNAIKGINKKAIIKVPSSKVKAYKKLFKSSTGFKKSMKIKK